MVQGEDWLFDAFQDQRIGCADSRALILARAIALSIWVYSLLFEVYLSLRMTINSSFVHLDDLFIDYVPFFTFSVTGITMMLVSFISLISYISIQNYLRPLDGSIAVQDIKGIILLVFGKIGGSLGRERPSADPESRKTIRLRWRLLLICSFCLSVWTYTSYRALLDPPSPPYWPIGLMMFVISFIYFIKYILIPNPYGKQLSQMAR